MPKRFYLFVFILFSLLLTSCASKNVNPSIVETNSKPPLILTFTPTLLPPATPTVTPTVTPIPTNTLEPSPTPIGNGFLKFLLYNSYEHEHYCGYMTSDGTIISVKTYEESQKTDRIDCSNPTNWSGVPVFSPDRSKYAVEENNTSLKISGVFTGEISLIDMSQFISDRNGGGVPIVPRVNWLDDKSVYFLDKNTDKLVLLDVNDKSMTNLGEFPSPIPDFYSQEFAASPNGNFILIHSVDSKGYALYLIDLVNSSKKNLTENLNFTLYTRVFWSPDSSRVVVFGTNSEEPESKMLIFNSDGDLIKLNESRILTP